MSNSENHKTISNIAHTTALRQMRLCIIRLSPSIRSNAAGPALVALTIIARHPSAMTIGKLRK